MGSENKTNDETSCQQPSEPKLCPMGCGFFGSPSTLSLYSKCFRERALLTEEEMASANSALNISFNPKLLRENRGSSYSFSDSVGSSSSASSSSCPFTFGSVGVGRAENSDPKLPIRCYSCDKKVGLTGFRCKCGSTFCGLHRYPETHDCSFDFKSAGRDAIAKANPVIKSEKLDRL